MLGMKTIVGKAPVLLEKLKDEKVLRQWYPLGKRTTKGKARQSTIKH